MRPLLPFAVMAVTLTLLSGCFPAVVRDADPEPSETSRVAGPTIPIPDVVVGAERALASEVGSPTTLDCGGNPDGVMPYLDGATIECVVTSEANPLPVRVAITLSVDGENWGFSTSDGANRDPGPDAPRVDGSLIEDLANDSFDIRDIDATVICEDTPVPIEVGHEVFCNSVLAGGGFALTVVEVTSFDGDVFAVYPEIIE